MHSSALSPPRARRRRRRDEGGPGGDATAVQCGSWPSATVARFAWGPRRKRSRPSPPARRSTPRFGHPPTPAEFHAETGTEQLAPVDSTIVIATETRQPDRDRYGRMLRYADDAANDAARELLAAGTRHRATPLASGPTKRPPRPRPQSAHGAGTGLSVNR